jgi:hypothetical protein
MFLSQINNNKCVFLSQINNHTGVGPTRRKKSLKYTGIALAPSILRRLSLMARARAAGPGPILPKENVNTTTIHAT